MSSQEESETSVAKRNQLSLAFMTALKASERPSIDYYLAQAPDLEQPELLPELVRSEHAYRWQTGELPTLAEYQARFPNHAEAIKRACFARPDEGGVPYALVEKLGAGGFGTAFRARDTELQRDVAVKVLNRDRLASTAAVSRFEQEIQTLAGIEHEGVVRVYSQGRYDDGQRFVVMQFVAGGSLRSLIESHGQGVEAIKVARIRG